MADSGSVLRRHAGDARLLATGAYAILLQVAHPTVGAGVSEHSSFRADPWGRLLRTLDYSYVMTYGDPERAAAMGRRIRAMHESIAGVRPDGRPYSALEPEAFAWVHGTLADAIVRGHALLGRPLDAEEVDAFYAEWLRNGELIGIGPGELPPDWRGFRDYFDRMAAETLERTAAVDEVVAALRDPAPPPLPLLPAPAWRLARLPAVHHILLITAGLLPAPLRERFGLPWSRRRELELGLLAAASRAATPLLPPPLRNLGPAYLRWRREAICAAQGRA